MQTVSFVATSREKTAVFARLVAEKLESNNVICLYGDLGAGKTTFTQAFAKALGVKEHVTSPTFVLLKQYKAAEAGVGYRVSNVYHVDAYRLVSSHEALDLGIEEIWSDPKNIVIIEWADKIADILPEDRIDITFEHTGSDARKITVAANSKLLRALKNL